MNVGTMAKKYKVLSIRQFHFVILLVGKEKRENHIYNCSLFTYERIQEKLLKSVFFKFFFWVPFSSIQEVSVWFLFRYQRNHRILKHIRTVFFVVFHSKTSREKDNISLMENGKICRKRKENLTKMHPDVVFFGFYFFSKLARIFALFVRDTDSNWCLFYSRQLKFSVKTFTSIALTWKTKPLLKSFISVFL